MKPGNCAVSAGLEGRLSLVPSASVWLAAFWPAAFWSVAFSLLPSCAIPVSDRSEGVMIVAHLGRDDHDSSGFRDVSQAFAQRNPGYGLAMIITRPERRVKIRKPSAGTARFSTSEPKMLG